jgi:hypothetical protein
LAWLLAGVTNREAAAAVGNGLAAAGDNRPATSFSSDDCTALATGFVERTSELSPSDPQSKPLGATAMADFAAALVVSADGGTGLAASVTASTGAGVTSGEVDGDGSSSWLGVGSCSGLASVGTPSIGMVVECRSLVKLCPSAP